MKIGLGGPASDGARPPPTHRVLGGGLSIRLPHAADAVLLGSQKAREAAALLPGGRAADRGEASSDLPKPGSDRPRR
jgi:hypothetical protein